MQEPPEELLLIAESVRWARGQNRGFEIHVGEEIEQGHPNYGKTDVIAQNGDLIYVIECKFINKTHARRKRTKVKEQAILYASLYKNKYPGSSVNAYIFTNEYSEPQFLREIGTLEARQRALEHRARVGQPPEHRAPVRLCF
tara:strand:- start:66 stop:491 length:426 start_codon:yes stop_codon:yes gene_type:complete